MEFSQFIALTIGATVTAIISAVVSHIKDIHAKHEAEQEEKDRTIEELKQYNKKIETTLQRYDEQITSISKNLESLTLKMGLMSKGGMVLLKDRIIQSCRVFIDRGSITLVAKENISEMYKWYKELGGNGTGDHFFDLMCKLPVEDTPYTSNMSAVTSAMGEVQHENL